MTNLPARLLFVFLVVVIAWLCLNILSVGGGKGLTAAAHLTGSAQEAAVAGSTATSTASGAVKDAAGVSAAKRVDDKASVVRDQVSVAAPAGSAVKDSQRQVEKPQETASDGRSKGDPAATKFQFERLTVLAALCGALGASLHALGSLVAFVGNGRFLSKWSMWYLAQPIRGAVLASGVYWAWAGNLLDPSSMGAVKTGDSAMALMFMVGLFSDPALEKLREVFMVLFRTSETRRADGLDSGRKPVITKLTASVVGAAGQIDIEGQGFDAGDQVWVNGVAQTIVSQTAIKIVVSLAAAVPAGTTLTVVVKPTVKGAIASSPASVVA